MASVGLGLAAAPVGVGVGGDQALGEAPAHFAVC